MAKAKKPVLGKKKIIDEDVYTLAVKRVSKAFDLMDSIIVMFSGGKDSTACLNLVLEEAKRRNIKKIEAHFFDEEAIPYETEEYVRRVSKLPEVDLKWWCLPVRHRNACSISKPWWFPYSPSEKTKWVRPLPPEALTELKGFPMKEEDRITIPEINGLLFPPEKYGNVGVVMGIRASESLTRTRAILNSRTRDNTHIIKYDDGTSQGNVYKVYPVYDWKTSDIWVAPRKYNWDYNTAYDVMDKMGISPDDQRCAPPYGEEPMRGLYQFKECFPNIWGKMSMRVEGAATAARYSNTLLYSARKNPEKPDNVSWQDFIKHWVSQHPDPYKAQVAKRIQGFIKAHGKKTKDPIMKATHPQTGIGWDFLLKIAVRGDYKDRKTPAWAMNNDQYVSMKRKYNEERYNQPTHK
tara:strand:- start:14020 stop:15240 length:1221 start_codon:yes stop_codon:yes gene_type:complete